MTMGMIVMGMMNGQALLNTITGDVMYMRAPFDPKQMRRKIRWFLDDNMACGELIAPPACCNS